MKMIRVAIVGVGGCASSLVQGVEYYSQRVEDTSGLTYGLIGGYAPSHIKFCVGFDIDQRKVGRSLKDAIYAKPNCVMKVIDEETDFNCIEVGACVYRGPTLDGFPEHMRSLADDITFIESSEEAIDYKEYQRLLEINKVDVLINYVPVGANEAAKFYIEGAIETGVSVVNCMPSYISTDDAMELERKAIAKKVTIVGSDMRSGFGASRLSEVLQGSLLDSGLSVTQHIQTNMAAGYTQGDNDFKFGRSANTDFLNMSESSRLVNKHISKENVLTGQSEVRGVSDSGMTMFAGPSLTVIQRPGGEYKSSDNKIANLDIIAIGFAGAKYELTCRLSVQDSPNSGAVVVDAIRFCQVAREMNIKGFLRGPSAWTQKTPPVQMKTADAKYECDKLANREYTDLTSVQAAENLNLDELTYTFQDSKTKYNQR